MKLLNTSSHKFGFLSLHFWSPKGAFLQSQSTGSIGSQRNRGSDVLPRWLGNCYVLCLLLITPALEAAKQETIPVDWQAAGEVVMSSGPGVRLIEMSDEVEVTQGNIVVKGDHAVFEYAADSGRLVRATIIGSPVNYRQQLEGDFSVVTGTSNTLIIYEDELTGETMIEMIGEATINSPDSSMNCAAILYNSSQNLIPSSTGPCGGSLISPAN